MANAVNWFEIPVTQFERAQRFYATVLGREVPLWEMNGMKMGMLMDGQEGVGGSIIQFEGAEPSKTGTLVYLNGGEDLSVMLSRVEAAGGKVTMPKTQITPEIGYMAVFEDCEGNRVAFHSPK
ncbi:VOC family protein [Parachitinimonas caeni]|uniref:VOC family protein n=1 Tax=Parachitinimonas caeni TaxID=3031301 RepID=A0ABT7DW24_9NEIS|nr:VOC family protein [Parachitinimonas caeni]MDK2124261.1 VOC family protein [Parachitinimonas caeni]